MSVENEAVYRLPTPEELAEHLGVDVEQLHDMDPAYVGEQMLQLSNDQPERFAAGTVTFEVDEDAA